MTEYFWPLGYEGGIAKKEKGRGDWRDKSNSPFSLSRSFLPLPPLPSPPLRDTDTVRLELITGLNIIRKHDVQALRVSSEQEMRPRVIEQTSLY